MLHSNIIVRSSEIEGTGLFTRIKIHPGEVVWTLDVNESQLFKKERDALPENLKKLAFQYYDKFIVVTDGSEYMNHSCNPNTWWTQDHELSAKRDIQVGEEITYDYSSADVGDWTASWQCICGAPNCRHTITGRDCLSSEFQQLYQNHLPSWTIQFIKENS